MSVPMRLLAALGLVAMTAPAIAGPSGDLLRDGLYAGELQSTRDALAPLAASDPEARFGLAFVDLVLSVERLGQTLYRHGLTPPNAGPMTPVLMLPVPPNPNPEPWDYQGVRTMFQNLATDLDMVRAEFEAAGTEGDYAILIDPMKVRIDLNADGVSDTTESISGMLALMTRTGRDSLNQTDMTHEIGFDRADAIWLAGYSDVLAAQSDFLLAHDFSGFVNTVFHRFFPKANFPMQEFSRGGQLALDPETDAGIADIIAAIHTVSWPVIEPERLKRVHARFGEVIAYSRRNWDAILAETDDNHELVPSPKQTPPHADFAVTDERVAAWRASLDQAQRILDGQLLLPHWRFKQGFDLKLYFETATQTDLVMILTGYGALPFLRDGPVASGEDFREAQQAFGSNWLGWAFWFN